MYTRAKKIGGKVMARGENNVNALAVADTHICCPSLFYYSIMPLQSERPCFPLFSAAIV